MIQILLDDIKSPKKRRCPFPTVSMANQSTGRLINHSDFYFFINSSVLHSERVSTHSDFVQLL